MAKQDLTLSEFQRRAAKARWAGLSKEERKDLAARGGRKRWEGIPPEERRARMPRRKSGKRQKKAGKPHE